MAHNPTILPDNNIMFKKGAIAVTTYPHICVKKGYWNSLSAASKAVLMQHEETHLKQQKHYTLFIFLIRYAADKSFRLNMEVEAYGAEINNMLKNKVTKANIIKDIANTLSGSVYMKMCSYDKAVTAIKNKYPALK